MRQGQTQAQPSTQVKAGTQGSDTATRARLGVTADQHKPYSEPRYTDNRKFNSAPLKFTRPWGLLGLVLNVPLRISSEAGFQNSRGQYVR